MQAGVSGSIARLALAGATALLLLVGAWFAWQHGAFELFGSEQDLRHFVQSWGPWAPLATVLLIAAAIIFSPIPSAPVAVMAGAVFGVEVGTALTIAGSVLGACTAFSISRYVGYSILRRWRSARDILDRLERHGSQNGLMTAVFVSRLIPFISFDAVSYAAGLTPLKFWRFAIATVIGVAPISLLLVKVGEGAADTASLMPLVIIVGMITVIPPFVALVQRTRRRRLSQQKRNDGHASE